jgi:phosphoglycerate dehydrogenase-like enzyme
MPRVIVTPRSMTADPPAELALLRDAGWEVVLGPAGRQPAPEELAELLPEATAWIAGVEPIGERELTLAPRLRVISRNGVGIDAIDQEAAARRGVRVLTAPGANASGVAELAIALMLTAARGIPEAASELRAGRWTRREGIELGSATVGVVGLGAIGARVADIAAGFGARVLGTDPAVRPEVAGRHRVVALEELLASSTVVSLHTPGPRDGTPVIGAAELDRLPDGAILVNTARWGVVDPDAVLRALESGRLAAYAVDAFAEEPPAPHPLLAHPAVIATPHLGALTRSSATRAAGQAIRNVLDAMGAASDARA